MRILLLSDIHANFEALESVFGFLRDSNVSYDRVVCLGDYVDYGPDPNEVIDFLKNRGGNMVFLLGNHDKALIDSGERNFFGDLALKCSLWTEKVISRENVEFIRGLKPTYRMEDILFVHASPLDPVWHYVYNEKDAYDVFKGSSARVIFVGHTHIPLYFAKSGTKIAGGVIWGRYATLKLIENMRYIINPGSVGQSRDGINAATFGIYDTDEREFRWFRIDYPREITKRKILERGLPSSLLFYI